MRKYYSIVAVAVMMTAVFQVPSWAQQKPIEGTASRLRSEHLKRLADDIRIRNDEDLKRVTKDYASVQLGLMRKVIQEQVLESLNQGQKPEEVRDLVVALFKDSSPWHDSGKPFVYTANFQGLSTVVVGYSWAYGTGGIPQSRVFIDGYRKVGLAYELADEIGQSMGECCALFMERIASPRMNESWFLARAIAYGSSRPAEMVRLYSFDGYQFKELWAPSNPRTNPHYEIGTDVIGVIYEDKYGRSHRETILLTAAGPIIATDVADPPIK